MDDVLGADVAECAAQYVVSVYRVAPVAERAEAVHKAIETVRGVGRFWEPLREMERVAVEALPDLSDFLARWRALIANKPAGKRTSDWDTDEDRWRREVVQRLEGPAGLEKVARSTRRAGDLRAWCKSLVDADDWKSALDAWLERLFEAHQDDPIVIRTEAMGMFVSVQLREADLAAAAEPDR